MLPAPVSTFPTRKPASPASMGSRSPNGNHPLATGYQAFDACSAAEYTGPPPGGSPLAGYRGGVISTHRPMGTPRARWCAPARSPPWFFGRACQTMLKGVSVARLEYLMPADRL